MKLKLIVILLFSTFWATSAQSNEEIINSLQQYLFGSGQDTIWLNPSSTKVIVDIDSSFIASSSGLKVPREIIEEWIKNSKNCHVAFWDENRLNHIDTLFFKSDTIISTGHVFRCISELELNKLFKNRIYFRKFYSISDIVYDNARENAVFKISFKQADFQSYCGTIVIKKIFGRWLQIFSMEEILTI